MFESTVPIADPAGFVACLKTRAESLKQTPTRDRVTDQAELASLFVPTKQIEQGSFQRFTQAERSRGG